MAFQRNAVHKGLHYTKNAAITEIYIRLDMRFPVFSFNTRKGNKLFHRDKDFVLDSVW